MLTTEQHTRWRAEHELFSSLAQRVRTSVGPQSIDKSIGLLRMTRVPALSKNGGDHTWAPLELVFGVPLSSLPLNAMVLDGMIENQLLDDASLKRQHMQMHSLSRSLRQFIHTLTSAPIQNPQELTWLLKDVCEGGSSVPAVPMTLPTRALLFDGQHIRLL